MQNQKKKKKNQQGRGVVGIVRGQKAIILTRIRFVM